MRWGRCNIPLCAQRRKFKRKSVEDEEDEYRLKILPEIREQMQQLERLKKGYSGRTILRRLGDHDARIDNVEDQSADPGSLPNLILTISSYNPLDDPLSPLYYLPRGGGYATENKWFACQLLFTFGSSIAIQAIQILLAIYLMEDGKNATADLVGKWIADELLEWNCPNPATCPNGTSADAGFAFESYSKVNGDYEIGMLEYAKEQTLTATRCDIMGGCGVDVGISNIAIGLVILGAFIVKDASAIFFLNQYLWYTLDADVESFCLRTGLALVIILGQIVTNVIVAVACGTKIVTSSLDLPETLSAAIEAFFILEIDDALLPFLTFIVQPKAHEFRQKENFHTGVFFRPATCLDCAKAGAGDKCTVAYIHNCHRIVVGFIATCYLVMLIAPVVVTLSYSVQLYGSE